MRIVKIDENILNILLENLNNYDEFWNDRILLDELNNPNSEYYALMENEILFGFGGIWLNIDEAHIMNIAVEKSMRKRGYGNKILNFLIDRAKQLNKGCITLEVREDNKSAISLYEKNSFSKVGKRKRYYKDLDAIIMTRNF